MCLRRQPLSGLVCATKLPSAQVEARLRRSSSRALRWLITLMTGDADYLLRVVVPDVDAYQRF